MNNRRKLVIALGANALAAPLGAFAQQSGKVARIGWLSSDGPDSSSVRIKAFQQRLHELGHIEGKNIVFEFRFAQGKLDQHPTLAAELVSLKPDCVLAVGVDAIRALKQSTNTIPIVMGTIDADPVEQGFAASLSRPGGNITGFTGIGWELAGKRLELLKEIVPKLSRAAFIFDPRSPASYAHLKETQFAARALRIQLQLLEARDLESLDNAFRSVREKSVEALFIPTGGLMSGQRPRIVNHALKARLPAIYVNSDWVRDGGLISYGSDITEQFRRAAIYVDKILKGAKPGDLPIEQPTKFELVINLNAAKRIGLTIPPNVLARADKVIE